MTCSGATSLELRWAQACEMCGRDVSDARVLGRRLSTRQGLLPRKAVGLATTIQRCRGCGLIFSNPMPLPADLGDHYDVQPSEYWADAIATREEGYFAEQITCFRRLWSGGRATPSALDIGAGLGKAMSQLASAGFETFGIEPSAPFREAAIEHNGIDPDVLLLGGIEHVDFAEQSFDFVTFGAVLEHLPAPSSAIQRALAWLRPGGLIHIEVPSADWLMARVFDALYRVRGLDYTSHLSPLHVPYHLFEFRLDAFEAHAHRFGYEIADHRYYVGDTYAPRWISPLLTRLMDTTDTGLQLEVWLRR
jgi:SAM-dependent methyltransferase